MGFIAKLMETHSNGGTDYNKFTLLSDDESADANIVDYVVEEYLVPIGTSGNSVWNYRKWNSGLVECWGWFSTSSLTWSAFGSTGFYYSSNYWTITLPFEFASTNYTISGHVEAMGNNFGWVARTTNYTKSTVDVGFVRNGNTGSCIMDLYVRGRWK